MPLEKVSLWLINCIDIDNRVIKDENGKLVVSIQLLSLDVYYKFPKSKLNMRYEIVTQFAIYHNYHEILKRCWIKEKEFMS